MVSTLICEPEATCENISKKKTPNKIRFSLCSLWIFTTGRRSPACSTSTCTESPTPGRKVFCCCTTHTRTTFPLFRHVPPLSRDDMCAREKKQREGNKITPNFPPLPFTAEKPFSPLPLKVFPYAPPAPRRVQIGKNGGGGKVHF